MTAPDPASGMEMDPEFVRLVEEYAFDEAQGRLGHGTSLPALQDLHRWHREQVEKAVRDMRTSASIRPDPGTGVLMAEVERLMLARGFTAWKEFVAWLELQTHDTNSNPGAHDA